jgi:hypothetical protein
MPKKIHLEVVRKMTGLATSGFGLVAALAWNELIKNFIDTFIKPLVGTGSVLISQFIYAVIVTALAVFITLQLSRLEQKLK